MTTLHMIRLSSFKNVQESIALLSSNDVLVLLDDGTYNINQLILKDFITLLGSERVYVIKAHAKARGLHIPKEVNAIELSDLIELTLTTNQSITWQ